MFARDVLVPLWLTAYDAMTPWETEVLEIHQGELVFLFDGAPTLQGAGGSSADDRVVAVWGRSRVPERPRDRSRMAGFLPDPRVWSRIGRDRGHFVANAAGGELDLNLFPQAARLNRGRSSDGRAWRRMERYAARHPGTPLFVRPTYAGSRWTPAALDHGLLVHGVLWSEHLVNSV